MVLHTQRRRKTNEKSVKKRKTDSSQVIKFWIISIGMMVTITYGQLFISNNVVPFDPVLGGDMAKWHVVEPPKKLPIAEFIDEKGDITYLSDLRGRWTLVNFWTTWCPPCIKELPTFQALEDQFDESEFQVVTISLDNGMTAERITQFAERYNLGDIIGAYVQDRSIHSGLGIKGLPTTILLDKNAVLRAVYLGESDWSGENAVAFVNSLVND